MTFILSEELLSCPNSIEGTVLGLLVSSPEMLIILLFNTLDSEEDNRSSLTILNESAYDLRRQGFHDYMFSNIISVRVIHAPIY